MYQFPPDLRKFYESMRIPFVIYQDLGGNIVPLKIIPEKWTLELM